LPAAKVTPVLVVATFLCTPLLHGCNGMAEFIGLDGCSNNCLLALRHGLVLIHTFYSVRLSPAYEGRQLAFGYTLMLGLKHTVVFAVLLGLMKENSDRTADWRAFL